MIEVKPYVHIPQIVPQPFIDQWQEGINREIEKLRATTPDKVWQFIEAVASNLGNMDACAQTTEPFLGKYLLLCGMKEWQGVPIDEYSIYSVRIPKLTRVDHRVSMLRYYHRLGPKKLINWCRTRCNNSNDVKELIDIYEEHVLGTDMAQKAADKL